MKKNIIKTFLISTIVVLSSLAKVNADTNSVTLKSSKEKLKPEETFTVTVHATDNDGINGVHTKYTYSEDTLELQSATVTSNTWSSMGSGNEIFVISNSTSKITNSDIYVLTFKVKSDAKDGSKAKFETESIMLDTDAAQNSQKTISAQKVEIEIKKDENGNTQQQDDNKQNYENTQQQDNKDNQEKEDREEKEEVADDNKQQEQQQIDIKEDNPEKDPPPTNPSGETPDKVLPQTGTKQRIGIIIGAISIIGLISYILYKKYRNI